VLSCEHGGNDIPAAFEALGRGHSRLLRSHRGLDLGAAAAAQRLAVALAPALVAPVQVQWISRLLIDCNRSPTHPRLFGLRSQDRAVAAAQGQALRRQVYLPHRERIYRLIEAAAGPVVHLAIHSFTPVWRGHQRSVDLGLLFDPRRPQEAQPARRLQQLLQQALPDLQIRRNLPYRGRADGLPTALRRVFGDAHYAGFEIELNQRHLGTPEGDRMVDALGTACKQAFNLATISGLCPPAAPHPPPLPKSPKPPPVARRRPRTP
jgi:predicted N-formylglutamate amidohydrolase